MHVPSALSAWRNLYEDRLNFRFVCLRILKFLAGRCGSAFENRRDFWSLLGGRGCHESQDYETDQELFDVVLRAGAYGIEALTDCLSYLRLSLARLVNHTDLLHCHYDQRPPTKGRASPNRRSAIVRQGYLI